MSRAARALGTAQALKISLEEGWLGNTDTDKLDTARGLSMAGVTSRKDLDEWAPGVIAEAIEAARERGAAERVAEEKQVKINEDLELHTAIAEHYGVGEDEVREALGAIPDKSFIGEGEIAEREQSSEE